MTVVYASIVLSVLIIGRIPYAMWKVSHGGKKIYTKADFNPWGSFFAFLPFTAFYFLFQSAEIQTLNGDVWWFNILNVATFTTIGFIVILFAIYSLVLGLVKLSGEDIVDVMNKKKDDE